MVRAERWLRPRARRGRARPSLAALEPPGPLRRVRGRTLSQRRPVGDGATGDQRRGRAVGACMFSSDSSASSSKPAASIRPSVARFGWQPKRDHAPRTLEPVLPAGQPRVVRAHVLDEQEPSRPAGARAGSPRARDPGRRPSRGRASPRPCRTSASSKGRRSAVVCTARTGKPAVCARRVARLSIAGGRLGEHELLDGGRIVLDVEAGPGAELEHPAACVREQRAPARRELPLAQPAEKVVERRESPVRHVTRASNLMSGVPRPQVTHCHWTRAHSRRGPAIRPSRVLRQMLFVAAPLRLAGGGWFGSFGSVQFVFGLALCDGHAVVELEAEQTACASRRRRSRRASLRRCCASSLAAAEVRRLHRAHPAEDALLVVRRHVRSSSRPGSTPSPRPAPRSSRPPEPPVARAAHRQVHVAGHLSPSTGDGLLCDELHVEAAVRPRAGRERQRPLGRARDRQRRPRLGCRG